MARIWIIANACAICIVLSLQASPSVGCGCYAFVTQVFELQGTAREAEIARLREMGPTGLEAVLQAAACLERLDPSVHHAIDAVAGQHLGHLSRLYWYTNIESAQAAAKSLGRPVLSLRLLGALTDEKSCANSRFFRSTLYVDPQIADLLRNHFVLHWQSERPVPLITIDFGDGRKLERTVTGNSIHYALSTEGMVLDALPGLYGPAAFHEWLHRMLELQGRISEEPTTKKIEYLRAYHRTALEKRDLDKLDVAFSQPARELIEGETPPPAEIAMRRAVAKTAVEATLVDIAKVFRESVKEDQRLNEQQIHPQIHQWLLEQPELPLDPLNDRIYAELFLTPSSDPWLGLAPAHTYTGLSRGGKSED